MLLRRRRSLLCAELLFKGIGRGESYERMPPSFFYPAIPPEEAPIEEIDLWDFSYASSFPGRVIVPIRFFEKGGSFPAEFLVFSLFSPCRLRLLFFSFPEKEFLVPLREGSSSHFFDSWG